MCDAEQCCQKPHLKHVCCREPDAEHTGYTEWKETTVYSHPCLGPEGKINPKRFCKPPSQGTGKCPHQFM